MGVDVFIVKQPPSPQWKSNWVDSGRDVHRWGNVIKFYLCLVTFTDFFTCWLFLEATGDQMKRTVNGSDPFLCINVTYCIFKFTTSTRSYFFLSYKNKNLYFNLFPTQINFLHLTFCNEVSIVSFKTQTLISTPQTKTSETNWLLSLILSLVICQHLLLNKPVAETAFVDIQFSLRVHYQCLRSTGSCRLDQIRRLFQDNAFRAVLSTYVKTAGSQLHSSFCLVVIDQVKTEIW